MKAFLPFIQIAVVVAGIGLLLSSCNSNSSSPAQTDPQIVAAPDTVNYLCVAPSGRVYAASIKGLFYSTNNGLAWLSGGADVTGRDIGSVLETPDGTIFAGSGGCGQPTGIVRSTDGAKNWSAVDNGLSKHCVGSLAFAAPKTLFAGIASLGILRSANNGDLWTSVNRGMMSPSVWCVTQLSDGSLVTGTIRGMYRSSTNGDQWTRIAQDSGTVVYSVVQCADGSLLASTENGLRRSTDLGASWSTRSTGLIGEAVYQIAAGKNGAAYVIGQSAVARSADNGRSWTLCGPIPPTWFSSIAVGPDGTLFVGTYAGIYRSVNGGSGWTLLQ